MSTTTTTNESLGWMTSVGVPHEDVLYLRRMAAYGGNGVEQVRARMREIQNAAFERLLAASMLPSSNVALVQ